MPKQLAFLRSVCVEITQRHGHTLLILTRLHYQQGMLSPPHPSTAAGRGFLEGGDYVGGYSLSALGLPSAGSSGRRCPSTWSQ